MSTIAHHIATQHSHTDTSDSLLTILGKKIVVMFRKENHTLPEYLLLYGLIFTGILLTLIVAEILFL